MAKAARSRAIRQQAYEWAFAHPGSGYTVRSAARALRRTGRLPQPRPAVQVATAGSLYQALQKLRGRA